MTFGTNVAVAAMAVLALSVAGCRKPAEAGLAKDKGPGMAVAEAEFKAAGKTWPLTVAEARVGCDAPGALYVLSDGKKYGLNDWAAGVDGYDDLSTIRIEAKKGILDASAKKAADPPPRKRRGGEVKPKVDYVPTDDLVLVARTACRW
jgi:hypothetical protein